MENPGGNRELLFTCALELFSRRGYDSVGVREIVEMAGVTKPTLYHYFHSKQGLFSALVEACGEEFLSAVRRDAEYRGDITRTLAVLAGDFFTFAAGHEKFYRMMLAQYFSPPDCEIHETVMAYNMDVFAPIERLFRAAEMDHGNMKGRSAAYAATFIGMLNTYIGLYLNGYAKLSKETSRRALHQFMHGIFS
jgi:TetR/AcrR family transcriptional regulator